MGINYAKFTPNFTPTSEPDDTASISATDTTDQTNASDTSTTTQQPQDQTQPTAPIDPRVLDVADLTMRGEDK